MTPHSISRSIARRPITFALPLATIGAVSASSNIVYGLSRDEAGAVLEGSRAILVISLGSAIGFE